MKRFLVVCALGLVAFAAAAEAATAPAKAIGLTAWTTAGSRLAFVATSVNGRRGYLWTQTIGVGSPRLLRTSPPVGQEEIDALAAGPNGTLATLERTVGNTESSYRVDVVSSRGGGAAVVATPQRILLLGDGVFLGYLRVTPAGVDLYRISGAHGVRVRVLERVASPQEALVANGHLAVRDADGTVHVFTTGGATLASIPGRAASIALTANRVVVRTAAKHLMVYGLGGGLVHDWKLTATSWTSGLAAYGAYAAYLGANKAVHAVRLANGSDKVVARAGSGFFFGGLALQNPGLVAPLTAGRAATFRVVRTAAL